MYTIGRHCDQDGDKAGVRAPVPRGPIHYGISTPIHNVNTKHNDSCFELTPTSSQSRSALIRASLCSISSTSPRLAHADTVHRCRQSQPGSTKVPLRSYVAARNSALSPTTQAPPSRTPYASVAVLMHRASRRCSRGRRVGRECEDGSLVLLTASQREA